MTMKRVLHIPQSSRTDTPTIRLFFVISRTLVGGGLTSLQRCSQCILQPQPTGLVSCEWGLEYADCISCRWVKPLKKMCSGYDTKLHWMVRFQFWRSGACRVLLHCQVFSGVVVPIKIPRLGQIYLKNYLYLIEIQLLKVIIVYKGLFIIIIIIQLKQYNCMKTNVYNRIEIITSNYIIISQLELAEYTECISAEG